MTTQELKKKLEKYKIEVEDKDDSLGWILSGKKIKVYVDYILLKEFPYEELPYEERMIGTGNYRYELRHYTCDCCDESDKTAVKIEDLREPTPEEMIEQKKEHEQAERKRIEKTLNHIIKDLS